VYIGGRVRGFMNREDPDAAKDWQVPAAATAVEGRMELNAQLPMAPSGWRVREALSYDLPYLWPAEYEATVRRFEQSGPTRREAFLRRAGVRWCVLPAGVERRWAAIAEVPSWNMRVFECGAGASRLAFTSSVRDLDALFDPALPDSEPLGEARLVEDAASLVTIEATVVHPAVLVLRDSYDPGWTAEVDGRAAPILRAEGIYRGVQLGPGRHLIRFSYRPRDFFPGLTVSVVSMLIVGFLGASNWRNRPNRRRDGGFTLVELMITVAVLSIVLGIAFSHYRNLQARGNEASAISSLRSIAAAQWQFALTCGNMRYATTLPALGQPVPTTGEPFLSPDLTAAETIEKSGYRFHLASKALNDAPPACNGAPVGAGYAVAADPVKPGTSGVFYYGVNADRVIYMDEEKSYTEDLPETGAAPRGREVK
jgi:prepilin-type N-terminal cleavage/methylation domain-containing protein